MENGEVVGGAGSEDSLKVDIYAPSGSLPDSRWPVMVYIHVSPSPSAAIFLGTDDWLQGGGYK